MRLAIPTWRHIKHVLCFKDDCRTMYGDLYFAIGHVENLQNITFITQVCWFTRYMYYVRCFWHSNTATAGHSRCTFTCRRIPRVYITYLWVYCTCKKNLDVHNDITAYHSISQNTLTASPRTAAEPFSPSSTEWSGRSPMECSRQGPWTPATFCAMIQSWHQIFKTQFTVCEHLYRKAKAHNIYKHQAICYSKWAYCMKKPQCQNMM